jgi:3-oxoacyl-[acyl-carrier protein] reductase
VTKPIAVVTGASRGIGLAVARQLIVDGYHVIGVQRSAPPAGAEIEFIAADMADDASLSAAIEEVTKRAPIAVLVNNAGISKVANIDSLVPSDFDAIAAVNIRAVIAATRAAVGSMKAAGFGRIINIGSRAALGKEGRSFYAASKAAVVGLTRTWALELGAHGITANTVSPGPIATELFDSTVPEGSAARNAILASLPVQRLGTPEDVAAVVAFFARPETSFITGQTLSVCGGITVGLATS